MVADLRRRSFDRLVGHLVLAIVLLATGTAVPLAALAQSATPAATPVAETYGGTPSTAILVTSTNAPRAIVGSDGQRHFEYDLIILNTFLAPITLTGITVLAPDGTELTSLDGDALIAATQPLLGGTPQTEIAVSSAVAVDMNVAAALDMEIESLTNQVSYEVPADAPDQALVGTHTTEGPVLQVAPLEPIIVAPPLSGDGWVALNGCCAANSVHRYVRVASGGTSIAKPEMFAIDWVRIEDGVFNSGEGDKVEDYFAYDSEVRSATAGTVVFARNDAPNQAPPTETGIVTAEDFGGNQVMVEVEPGVFAWYAHLKPGSVLVEVGDTVTVGQPIGRLGNSGLSTAPHLHFGLLDAPNPTTGTALPIAIAEYELAGTIDPAILNSPNPPPDGMLPIDTATVGPQTETWPLYLTVVDFP